MTTLKKTISSVFLLAFLTAQIFLSGCKVGEDDPSISFRSRNKRLMNDWKLARMSQDYELTTFRPGTRPSKTINRAQFDGRNIRFFISTDSIQGDTTLGFGYNLDIKENGKILYNYTFAEFGIGVRSEGKDNWIWINDDREKSKVFIGDSFSVFASSSIFFPLPSPLGTLFQDLEIKELRKDKLVLIVNKKKTQANLDGSLQDITLSGEYVFVTR